MQPDMVTLIVAVVTFVLGAVMAVLLFRNELRRIDRFLIFHQPGTTARLTSHVPNHEVVELVRAINRQLDAMQTEQVNRNQERVEFQHQLANFSHDVRTPLTGAKGYLQLALDEPNRVNRTRYLEAAGTQIDDMRKLLDQLHTYTQSADPDAEFDIHNIQIMPLIANVLYGFYPEFEARSWEPQVDFENEGFFAPCDESAMKRIIENLVSNALKYGSSSLSITQRERSIWFANQIEKPLAIDVNRIFERFFQMDPSRNEGGSGLGLAVVANLAHAMKLDVKAEVEGTEFRIRIDFPS